MEVKIVMLEKKIRNHKRQLSVFNTVAKPGSDDEEPNVSDKEGGNMKHSAFNRKGTYKSSKKA